VSKILKPITKNEMRRMEQRKNRLEKERYFGSFQAMSAGKMQRRIATKNPAYSSAKRKPLG